MFKNRLILCLFAGFVVADSLRNVWLLNSGRLLINAVILLSILVSLVTSKLIEEYVLEDSGRVLFVLDSLMSFMLLCIVGLDIYVRYW